ncbi:hypothetical protein DFJ58DRAFT_732495 [Suillus subalutaceus]|uniref:uncharacterized protein n=1 Tax=Suillus subalutaceus TaxID=48586 RepID=UPI001B86949F|nr:uncharacterized protein DFJ58DRAFT_732495 [Suillus subalutaceus]KAG1841321.1 hypothetical protein DFJ58DRAFT_732495 [Suillus subalutaceus]
MTTRIAPAVRKVIQLTDAEDHLCTLLDEFTRHLQENKNITTACRINGGWVRDKVNPDLCHSSGKLLYYFIYVLQLLGMDSNDIDICLADMMGVTFAEGFVAFLSEQKHLHVHRIAKIESNPNQSKHLETARTTLLGMDLDFVNLRSEEYAEDSRIPTEVKFGTPLEDALRRDLTINTLFYNVHTRSVEDFTEKGLEDLQNGIIRTPLPPRETFLDDPLRVIRCIRFASRFGFEIESDLQQAAQLEIIQDSLAQKISRERVGEELDKMMKGQDPLRSIRIINDLKLYKCIYPIPPQITSIASSAPKPQELSLRAATILHGLLSSTSEDSMSLHPTLRSYVLQEPGCKARLFLAASLYSYHGITYLDPKGKEQTLVKCAIQDGLKLGRQNHYLDGIPPLYSASEFLNGVSLEQDRLKMPSERVAIALLLRQESVHNINTGSHWASSLVFALVCELVSASGHEEAAECVHRYNALTRRVEELGLDKAADAKLILNGKTIARAMDERPGPWMKAMLNMVLEWQLEHPDGTQDDCLAWLNEEKSAGRIDLEELKAATMGNKRVNPDEAASLKKVKR